MGGVLIFKSGPEIGGRFPLSRDKPTVVGSCPTADLVISNDPLASTEHFVIERTADAGYRIRNLAREPGTRLNGTRIDTAPLKNGDIIQAGLTAFEFLSTPITSEQAKDDRAALPLGDTLPFEAGASPSAKPHDLPETIDDDSRRLTALASRAGYRLGEEIGRGRFGRVYKAFRSTDEETVAIKMVMLKGVSAYPESQKKLFRREMRIHKVLKHPHIVRLLEEGELAEDMAWFALEYFPGEPLDCLIRSSGGGLTIQDAGTVALQVLSALEYAHGFLPPEGPFVHRDIKPRNILAAGAPGAYHAKLTDFGLAKNFEQAGLSGLTRTGQVIGTLEFMSPEQLTDSKYVGPEVDLYAVGAVLYFCLSGRLMYPVTSQTRPSELVEHILHRKMIPIRTQRAGVPPGLAEVIDRAVGRDPVRRFHNARQMKAALQQALVEQRA
jgi:serine/threonine protein kinase